MPSKELLLDPWTEETDTPQKKHPTRNFLRWLTLVIVASFCFSFASPSTTKLAASKVWTIVRDLSGPPLDPEERALKLLSRQPIIDGHIDLPILVRHIYANQLDKFDLRKKTKGQVDIPRLRKGRVGGFFLSVYVPCASDIGYPPDNEGNFTASTHRVRDTLEQIDVARLLVDRYSETFQLVSSAREWRDAMKKGKIASMLGVEGGHQLGSTLSTIRTYYSLGVRYITLTHTCNNALADSCGSQDNPLASRWNGLSSFGEEAIREMNRLGMVVDVSHTAPKTASDALSISSAPVIFSHSNARGLHSAVRNIPDSILRRIGKLRSNRPLDLSKDGEQGVGWGSDIGEVNKPIKGGDALIMLNFSPDFVSQWPDGTGQRANVSLVADHADYIGDLAGRASLGIGSDLDGILSTPVGLEDVSTYPALIAELIRRGWSDTEILGLAGGNLLRILDAVEAVARKSTHLEPSTFIFEGRDDLKPHDGF